MLFLNRLPAEQPRILQRIDIRQITQRLQAEGRKELLCRDLGIRRPGVGLRGPEARKLALRRVAVVSRLISLPKVFDRSLRVIGWK